jgi:hypothetical protein
MGSTAGDAGIIDVGVLGTVIRIRTTDVMGEASVRHAWHLAVLPDDGTAREVPEERTVALAVPGANGSGDDSRAMVSLTQRVTMTALTARRGQAVHFHAGGVCHPSTGAAFVYVAPGGTGKTTLTRTLGPGYAYVSDETIAVSRDGSIAPYLKPLSVRREGESGVKDELAPGDLGLRAPTVTPRLAALVILRRVPGATFNVKTLSTRDAVVSLSPETSAIAALDSPLRRVADLVESVGGLRVVTYSEGAQLAGLVSDAIGDPS